eukprot:Trichotokara_eunicae@DN6757_c0_g1_i1.p1
MGEMTDAGMLEELKKAGGPEALVAALEQNPGDLDAVMATARTFRKMTDGDADVAAMMGRRVAPLLLGESSMAITSDPVAAKQVLELLKSIAQYEGNGRMLANTAGFKETLESISVLAQSLPEEEMNELLLLVDQCRKAVEDDDPQVLTLRQVREKWDAKKKKKKKKKKVLCVD